MPRTLSAHERLAIEKRRQGIKFYQSKRWRELRALKLAKNRTCEHCGAAATHVDHMLAREKRPDLELAMSNLQSLCHSCHSRKTAARDGGYGNPRRGA